MRITVLSLIFLMSGLMVLFGCGRGEEPIDEKELAASVEDWTLTKQALEEVLQKLPRSQKKKYDSPRGRAELADRYLAEQLFYLAGKKIGIENTESAKKAIDEALRRIIIAEYYKNYVEKEARPTEKEMLEYYESNKDDFISMEVRRARHFFSKSKDKIFEMKERIDAGEKMTELTVKYSEDQTTKRDAGDLGYFNPGGFIRFVGYSQKFSDAVFSLEPMVVSDPIEWEKGWSIVVVTEVQPERLRPFDEAKSEISRIITSRRIDLAKDQAVQELKERYDARNYMQETAEQALRSPEELWNLAQTTTDSYERLRSYQEIVQRYPNSEYVPQALFMLGFVSAEELMDFVAADRYFRQVIASYPGTDVAKSADWMLQNLNKPLPEFKDLDDLHEKISEESKKSE
ncbi:MAG: tetratricopeptide repeat protein [Candidatus Latescibacteria bacterium]|nr:tetratricopeptide repeat protein [Candidatus Latescibacterota bacterium]NIM21116.1 tetratricopeptide repeat protein [Candidatus Latescibacterota bacterium]NIM65251.1 tetratricopeptide repeat protein [Candidatus Latescibacterota bacterium]NIO01766.1 tetratricopeptide repeat protein [Candidatus Latescibacterota bacterium]NIO28283.1 tetratricopeptide repeat protein [Candidatus Latescibacterota bacterium]